MRKSFFASVCFAISTVLFAPAAFAGPVHSASGGVQPDRLQIGHLQEMSAIRNAALKQQAMDGGVLTPKHLAKFQGELDRENAFYRRLLVNNNPLTVDADGHPNSVPPNTDWTWSDLMRTGASG